MCEAGRRNMLYAHPQRHKDREVPKVPVKQKERVKRPDRKPAPDVPKVPA